MKKIIITFFLSLGLVLSGCSLLQKKDEAAEEKTEQVSTIVIGDQTENSKKVTLINDTGDKIVGLFIKKSSESNYKNNLLTADGAMDRKDKRLLYVENTQEKYDMTIIVNQKNYVLHDIPFFASNTFEIHLGENYGYVIYKDGGNVVSTEEDEKNRIEPKEEEPVEEVVEEAAPVEEVNEPSTNYNPNTNYDYYEDNSYYYEEPQPEPEPEQPVIEPEPQPVEQPVTPEQPGE